MRLLLATLLFCFTTLVSAAETRFDSLYFFSQKKPCRLKG